MKRTVDGKTYNTETANFIASWSNDLGWSDFRHVEEDLYVTGRGNFFLCGKGGPSSHYARSCGSNTWSEGSGIITLTREEALEWCEIRDEQDAIEEHFADLVEEG